MIAKIRNLFINDQQFKLFMILCLSTLFNFAMIGMRMSYMNFHYSDINSISDLQLLRGTTGFLFLIWNLFLAWIPYWISLTIESVYKNTNSKIIVSVLLFIWLLFFPNAPYIITDLLHLRDRAPIPHWYDVMMIASFAWTGLMLGLLSLYEVQLFFKKRINPKLNWLIVVCSIGLCGFGIYVGRFLRWNSWDIITNPVSLISQLLDVVINSDAYGNSIWVTIVLSAFLLIAYLKMVFLIGYDKR